jgi:general secretion pathway protein I
VLAKLRPADAGFTLIEVLVALIIAALALGVLYQGSVGGMRSAKVASRYNAALSRAQSHMAGLMVQTGFRAGRQSGKDGGGFTWQTQVRPLGVAMTSGPPQPTRPALYALTVTESWRSGAAVRRVTLHSERLGAVAVQAR